MIKRGDIVTVNDWGGIHSASYNWFIKHRDQLETGWIIRYAYGMYVTDTAVPDQDFKVLYIDEDDGTALIELVCVGTHPLVFLVDIDALSDKKIRLTKKELERLIGFEFDLEDDKE